MTTKKSNKGMQRDWIEIVPEKEETLLAVDNLIQRGKVIGAGPKSVCKVGDTVIVRDWQVEKVRIVDETLFFTTDENVIKIL